MYKAKKELGQNFLTDFTITHKMVEYLDLTDGDTLVEIGAGLGAITQEVSEEIRELNVDFKAIEIDERFVAELKSKFSNDPKINIIQADVLQWLARFKPQKPFKIIGSLPYYINSPILHAIVRHTEKISTCVLLIQKEVARKISQKSPDASYFSTYLQTFFDVTFEEIIPREKFDPTPKVDGAIIKLMLREDGPRYDVLKKSEYEDFLHKGFSKPRKMLNKVFSKEFLSSLKTDDKLRPQHIDVKTWIKMFEQSRAQQTQ